MPFQLSQSYKFKFFYYNKNSIAMDEPLIIDDHSGASSSHVSLPSSIVFSW
jgi:hypothetical protein